MLAFLLIIIGALNWGLWGFFQFDIVAWLFKGNTTWLSRLIYAIIGLAGLWSLRLLPRCRHLCCDTECSSKGGKGGKGGCCN
jgi:uncharacterized membrane protein YuzA (DUF378 family)